LTERRRFLRFTAKDIGVEYRICHEREVNGSSCAKDLSREGMRFATSKKIERGTLVDIKFLLPGEPRPVYLTGEVAWTSAAEEEIDPGYMIGIKFFKINNFDRARLLDHAYTEWLKSSKSC
jgi:hypothetical protein